MVVVAVVVVVVVAAVAEEPKKIDFGLEHVAGAFADHRCCLYLPSFQQE